VELFNDGLGTVVPLEVKEYCSKGEFDILSSASLGRINITW